MESKELPVLYIVGVAKMSDFDPGVKGEPYIPVARVREAIEGYRNYYVGVGGELFAPEIQALEELIADVEEHEG